MSHIILNTVSNKNIDDLLDKYMDVNTFYFDDGEYELTKTLIINREGVRMVGLGENAGLVKIKQTSTTDSVISISANNFGMEYITVDGEGTDGICLNHGNAEWSTIEKCYFYGNATGHTVYFGGPYYDSNTTSAIDLFQNDGLNKYNTFNNNVIYTKDGGISLSFNMQQDGSIRDNIIRGGKLSIYLIKNVLVTHNYIHDSSEQGMSISTPIQNVNIYNNKIRKCNASGINIKIPDDMIAHKNLNQDIKINNNIIEYCNYIGFEINGIDNMEIKDNVMKWISEFGLYILKSSNLTVTDNTIIQYKRAVHVDIESDSNTISNNTCYSVFPTISEHAIVVEELATNTTIENNLIYGQYVSTTVKNSSPTTVENNNTYEEHVSFNNDVLKLT